MCPACKLADCGGCIDQETGAVTEFELLLCRVALGRAQVTTKFIRHIRKPTDGRSDSVVAYAKEVDPASSFAGTQFAAYKTDQVACRLGYCVDTSHPVALRSLPCMADECFPS